MAGKDPLLWVEAEKEAELLREETPVVLSAAPTTGALFGCRDDPDECDGSGYEATPVARNALGGEEGGWRNEEEADEEV